MTRALFAILVLSLCVGSVQAQYKPGSSLLVFNVGITEASPEDSDKNLDGYTYSFNYEKSNEKGNLAGGVGIAWVTTSADSAGPRTSVSYDSLPVMLYGRFLFGSPRIRAYAGGGAGVHFSSTTFYDDDQQVEGSSGGFLISGAVGVNFFLNEKLLLNGNYNLSYLNNSYYQDGTAHSFTLGLGFQLN